MTTETTQADATAVATKQFYPYEPAIAGSPLMVYAGEPVEVKAGEDGTFVQPANSSPFAPLVLPAPEGVTPAVAFWSGYAWVMFPDLRNMAALQLQTIALRAYASQFASTIASLTAKYPAEEQTSWTQQLEEAKAVTADPKAAITLLPTLAAAAGKTVAELAASIIANAADHAAKYGAALADYQQKRRIAEAATKLSDIPSADHLLLIGFKTAAT